MEIYIKDMEMPKSCRYCEFFHMSLTQNAFCTAAHETIDYMAERTKRLDNCPLIPIPEPHGDLIDRDALPTTRVEWEDILNAPTIIPASEEGE